MACVLVCAVSAIFAAEDLPEKWNQYTELNGSYVKAGKFTPGNFRPDEYCRTFTLALAPADPTVSSDRKAYPSASYCSHPPS